METEKLPAPKDRPRTSASKPKLSLSSRLQLSDQEKDFLDFALLAGITIDPDVFKSLLHLLQQGVQPQAVYEVLQKLALPSTDD